jgi:hypothetical protein
MDARWTIRGISLQARAMMEELHASTGIPYGRLISLAIQHLVNRLPPEGLLLQLRKLPAADRRTSNDAL